MTTMQVLEMHPKGLWDLDLQMHSQSHRNSRAGFFSEFRNRLDGIIQFNPLPKDIVRLIVDHDLRLLNAQVFEKNVTIEATDEAKDFLCDKGYKPGFGAREMARVFHKYIKQSSQS